MKRNVFILALGILFFSLFPSNSFAEIKFYFESSSCLFGCTNGTTPCGNHTITPAQNNLCGMSANNVDTCGAMAAQACGLKGYVATFIPHTVPGTVSSWDFHPVESIPGVPGPPDPSECHFQCTGLSLYGCPYAFEVVSEINQPLECHNGDFNLVPVDGTHCHQLASDTCHQTVAPYIGSATVASGKIGEDGSLPSQTPTPPSTSPYTAEEGMYEYSCLQYNPNMQTYYWIPGCFNPLLGTVQQDPTQFVNPLIHVQSIIGPQGETLNMDQAFYNMAVQQLIDRNNKTAAPVKK